MDQIFLESIISAYFKDEKCLNIEMLNGGLTNFNYKILMPNYRTYFLKIFRNAVPERVSAIAGLIKNIADFHFPTPALILCEDGAIFWQNGKQSAIMTDYIRGSYPENNPENLYKIGAILAALHQIPVNQKLLQGYSLNYFQQIKMIREGQIVLPEKLKLLLALSEPIIQDIPFNDFPESIIHGDIFLDNILMTDLEDLYFIDFEGGCVDKSIFDLARAIIGCTTKNLKINLTLAKALISGYNIIRPLEPLEHKFLYHYIIYAGTVSTLWRFIEFNIKRPFEDKSSLYQDLLEPTINLFNIDKDLFTDILNNKSES